MIRVLVAQSNYFRVIASWCSIQDQSGNLAYTLDDCIKRIYDGPRTPRVLGKLTLQRPASTPTHRLQQLRQCRADSAEQHLDVMAGPQHNAYSSQITQQCKCMPLPRINDLDGKLVELRDMVGRENNDIGVTPGKPVRPISELYTSWQSWLFKVFRMHSGPTF